MKKRHYLDYAATAPLRPEAFQAMLPWLGLPPEILTAMLAKTPHEILPERLLGLLPGLPPRAKAELSLSYDTEVGGFGNANALYAEGKAARQALEAARASLAACIGAQPPELVFTSGGTEADAAAIAGITAALRTSAGKSGGNHLIYSAFEHRAVSKAILQLKSQGFTATELKPRDDGFVHPDDLAALLRPETVLVSVMLVQNELGTIQPVTQLARLAHQNGSLVHCDAVQALGKLPLDMAVLGVDAASFSAHKIGGPKGCGALYLRQGTAFAAPQRGGGQEGGRRGGTQDVASAMGFAAAARIACEPEYLARENERLAVLRDSLAAAVCAADDRFALTIPLVFGDVSKHASSIVPLLVSGQQSEMMVLRLDEAGIAASGGSACSNGSLDPSHVLTSIGVSKDRAYGSLRLSLGWASSEADIQALLAVLPDTVV
jgi:cysteine desulfurase